MVNNAASAVKNEDGTAAASASVRCPGTRSNQVAGAATSSANAPPRGSNPKIRSPMA